MNIAFVIYAIILIGSACGVVAFRDPIRSGLCLVVNLLGVAGIFAAFGAHFLAVTQVIVYAGAIVVLVLFVLMLLNVKSESQGSRDLSLTVSGGIAVAGLIIFLVSRISTFQSEETTLFVNSATPIEGTVKALGQEIYTKYVFSFEAASILIMAALVGAVMISKRKSNRASLHPHADVIKPQGASLVGGTNGK